MHDIHRHSFPVRPDTNVRVSIRSEQRMIVASSVCEQTGQHCQAGPDELALIQQRFTAANPIRHAGAFGIKVARMSVKIPIDR
jgi:hypothetical protein